MCRSWRYALLLWWHGAALSSCFARPILDGQSQRSCHIHQPLVGYVSRCVCFSLFCVSRGIVASFCLLALFALGIPSHLVPASTSCHTTMREKGCEFAVEKVASLPLYILIPSLSPSFSPPSSPKSKCSTKQTPTASLFFLLCGHLCHPPWLYFLFAVPLLISLRPPLFPSLSVLQET